MGTDERTLSEILASVGWRHEKGSDGAQGRLVYDASGVCLGQLTAQVTLDTLRERGLVACNIAAADVARVDVSLADGRVIRGAAVHGSGGVCTTVARARQVLRSARLHPTVRIYTDYDASASGDLSFEVPRESVLAISEAA
jgi:hypothetical protein